MLVVSVAVMVEGIRRARGSDALLLHAPPSVAAFFAGIGDAVADVDAGNRDRSACAVVNM